MEKIWYRGNIKYLHKKGLGSKDIHVDMVLILGDDAYAVSNEQKWVAEFKWCIQYIYRAEKMSLGLVALPLLLCKKTMRKCTIIQNCKMQSYII